MNLEFRKKYLSWNGRNLSSFYLIEILVSGISCSQFSIEFWAHVLQTKEMTRKYVIVAVVAAPVVTIVLTVIVVVYCDCCLLFLLMWLLLVRMTVAVIVTAVAAIVADVIVTELLI